MGYVYKMISPRLIGLAFIICIVVAFAAMLLQYAIPAHPWVTGFMP